MVIQIQAYLVAHVPHFRTVQVSWFGGEPTLCKDVVLETCALIQAAQAGEGTGFTAYCVSGSYRIAAYQSNPGHLFWNLLCQLPAQHGFSRGWQD